MEPTKPKLPPEAIELYNDFIHGENSRHAFVEGVQRLAGGRSHGYQCLDAELCAGLAGLPHR